MRAWVVRQLGKPDSMVLEEVEEGPPPADKVRVKIESAAVNFPDALLVAGLYQVKPELPFVVGLEVAGTVQSAPAGAHAEDVTMFKSRLLSTQTMKRGSSHSRQYFDTVMRALMPSICMAPSPTKAMAGRPGNAHLAAAA